VIRRRTLVLLIAICVGHVLLISAQVQSRSGLPLVESAAFASFAGVQRATGSVVDFWRGLWSHYAGLRGAAAENEQLKQQVLQLQGQVQAEHAIASEAQDLQNALGLKQTIPAPTVAARVIAGGPSPGALTVTIDRGSSDGITSDMPVIGAAGVVGRVINRPMPHAAQVQLLIGRSPSAAANTVGAAAAVTFEKSGSGGIVVGGVAESYLRADYVSNLADVQVGERVVTSGLDGIFPAGYLVGTVAQSDRGATYRTVLVKPAVDFSHLDIVLVVLQAPQPPQTFAPDPVPPARPAPGGGRGRGGA
jgi:rod shape-determining protein MreC